MFSATARKRRAIKVRQACDACHVRKVRCDGGNPCTNCVSLELSCTYLAVPKKKGPKGRRPKVISPKSTTLPYVLNKAPPATSGYTARDPPLSSLTSDGAGMSESIEAIPKPSIDTGFAGFQDDIQVVPDKGNYDFDPPTSFPQIRDQNVVEGIDHSFEPSPLVTNDLFRSCLDAFFIHKYPIMPIMDRDQTFHAISTLHDNPRVYAMMTALSAVIVQQPEILELYFCGNDSMDEQSLPSSDFLIKETVRARQFCDHIESPTIATAQTSFFLFAALFCLGKENSAYYYIREATTMLQLLRLHEESTYTSFQDTQYATYCRRTFWLLFITERAYALQRHRPLTLQRTIKLPTVDPGPEAHILSGFLDLVSLFQNFDDTFLSLWNLSDTDSPASTQSLMQLQDILKFAIPNVSERTEIQQADLLVSRQWLKTMVWQLCVSKGLLSSTSANESMSFYYPVTIARDVVLISRLLPPKAFEANGVGILEKVFDIGCSLADVLSLTPRFGNVSALEIGPRDYLMELVRILGTTPGGKKYLGMLASKADECLGVRIQSSLSDSDASDRIIEEIEDLSEDDSNMPGTSDLRDMPNPQASFNREEDMVYDIHDYRGSNHDMPNIEGLFNSKFFGGIPDFSTHNGSASPTQTLSNLSKRLFPRPIAHAAMHRQHSEHHATPDAAMYWKHHSGLEDHTQYGDMG